MSKHLIVGGGVYGAAVAWHLAKNGEAVELIEAGKLATGASGGPGRRGVRANGRDVREIPLMVRAKVTTALRSRQSYRSCARTKDHYIYDRIAKSPKAG